jgi:hypothetical protein
VQIVCSAVKAEVVLAGEDEDVFRAIIAFGAQDDIGSRVHLN